MSLLARLLLLVLLAVLPAIGVEAYNELELRAIREKQVHEEALRLARVVDSEMDRIAEGTRQLLVAVAENPAVADGNSANCDAAVSRLLPRLTGYSNIGVAASTGEIVCAAAPETRGINLRTARSFQSFAAADGFTIGVYENGTFGAGRALPFAEPLQGTGGAKTGIVWAALDLDWLAGHFAARFQGSDITLAVVDRDGTALLRLPDPEKWIGHRLADQYTAMLRDLHEGTIDTVGMDRVRRIIGYAPLSTQPRGLYVGVGLSKATLFAGIDHATLVGAILIGLCLCLALLAAWAGGTIFLRRPLQALLRASERWRQGDYAARSGIAANRSEIGRLGGAFDEMARAIEQREEQAHRFNETLEHRVAERTAELVQANRRLALESEERQRAEVALLHAQRIESIGQLTGGVAHDFNNLLTAVLGNLEIAQMRVKDGAILHLLTGAARAAERGARLTGQLLAFSRKQRLRPRPVDINQLVRGMSEMLERSIGSTIRLEQQLAAELWPAMTDPTQIELVILNLAINARDAMPLGGRLTLATDNAPANDPHRPIDLAPGDYVRISVADTGSGMTEEVLSKAAEPFFTTKEAGKGSGLGLSMVYGVARQSGGAIALSSRVGEGTTARVYLPRAAEARQPSEGRIAAEADFSALADRKVLVIDDDEDVRQVTAALLTDLDCSVIEADSGKTGLAALDREPNIDLAVIDFAMPGMNGLQVADAILAERPDMPLLIVTGYAEIDFSEPRRRPLRVLNKPFQRNELAEALLRAIADAADEGSDDVVRLTPASARAGRSGQ